MANQPRLTDAYHKLLMRLKENWHVAQTELAPKLHYLIEKAKETALAAQEMSHEEAELIGRYLQRDVEDAQCFLKKTGKELKDWLVFDWQLAEQQAWEALQVLADKTTIDRLEFEHELKEGPFYHTGEITGIGTLVCQGCGKILHFQKLAHIPPCASCHATRFARLK